MCQIANIKSLEVIVNKSVMSVIYVEILRYVDIYAKMHKVPLQRWTAIYQSGPHGN